MVTKNEVEHIAELARLKFNDDELQNFTTELNKILNYVEKLNELDTENVEPLWHPVEGNNEFREDKIRKGIKTEEALKNAPDKDEKFFKVPKVIEKK